VFAVSLVLASIPTGAMAADPDTPRAVMTGPDGTPFFPIGLYGFPQGRKDDVVYREARDAGFNFLVGHEAKLGFARSFDLPGGPPDPDAKTRRGSLLDLTHQAETKRAMLGEIAAKEEHTPGVIVWQGPDEPNYFPFGVGPGATPEGLAAGAAVLRARSTHPLWINFGPTGDDRRPEDFRRLRPYLAVPDVVSVDIYPVGGGSDLQRSPFAERGPACVGVFTRNLVRMVSRDGVQQKPVWMVLQAFGWGDLARSSNPPESWTGPTPTHAEVRFMTFDAVINGASGVVYWGAPFLPRSDPNATWESLKSVAAELRDLLPVLTAEAIPADQVVAPSNPAVEAAVRRSGGKLTLLLANTSAAAQETTLSFLGLKPKGLNPVGKTDVPAPPGAPFRLRLGPLQVAAFNVAE
jgi:hypothetical protein